MENRKKSVLKSITYRIICITSLLTVTYTLTKDIYQTSSITLVFQIIQIFIYYAHERAWAHYWPTIR